MKIKCPACSKILAIPETAAGKVVACPCGKQLRAPAASGSPASAPSATSAPSAPTQPTPRPTAAPQPSPQAPATPQAPAAPQAPKIPVAAGSVASTSGQYVPPEQRAQQADGLFDDLTVKDLEPVKSVSRPGVKATVNNRMPAQYADADDSKKKKKKKKSKKKSKGGESSSGSGMGSRLMHGIGGGIAVAAGIGILVWFFTAYDPEEGRVRGAIKVGVGLIIAGFGWIGASLGLIGDDDS